MCYCMKITTPLEEKASGLGIVDRLELRWPAIEPAIAWLRRNKADPKYVIEAMLVGLQKRGRNLPSEQRLLYARKIVLGEFLARWASKHHTTSVAKLQGGNTADRDEVRTFCLTLALAADQQAFRRVLPRLARTKAVAGYGREIGNDHDFSCFAVSYGEVIAHRFLSKFNPDVSNPAAKAVNYLQVTAVSHYLHIDTTLSRAMPSLPSHLEKSKRIERPHKTCSEACLFARLIKRSRTTGVEGRIRFLRAVHSLPQN